MDSTDKQAGKRAIKLILVQPSKINLSTECEEIYIYIFKCVL